VAERGGLEDVVACTTEICAIDGHGGRLIYRGYDVRALAGRVPFEHVCHLLWMGNLPTAAQASALQASLYAAAVPPPGFADWLGSLPVGAAMDALRTAVSVLGMYDGAAPGASGDQAARAVRLTAQLAWITAAWWRLRQGLAPLSPRRELGHAANFLYMLTGCEPPSTHVRAMDAAMVLHADHELNASTFAARVTAATLADMYAAVTAAVATLAGPLHGGANESVMRVVEDIGAPERAEAWVRRELEAGRRIPGFGHRVYRTCDPRAVVLRELAHNLAEAAGDRHAFLVTQALEEAVLRLRGLYPNVDLYSGTLYRLLGIPVALFTPTFAVARVSGWTAHVMEQYRHNRLIRPRAEYVGPSWPEVAPHAG
jgi:citrate synthase